MQQQIARLRIELEHIEPRIWRCVDVPVTTRLRALHDLIQAVMPWESYHLYEFTVGDRVHGEPDPEDTFWGRKVFQATSQRCAMLIERGVTEFLYTYDLGDNWQHRVIVESVLDADPAIDYRYSSAARGARHLRMSAVPPASWTS